LPDPAGRFVVGLAAAAVLCGTAGYGIGSVLGQPAPRRISLTAKKFEFDRPEIHVRKGERVTFVLTSLDFAHGFSIPDLAARVDLVPGKAVELTVLIDRAGRLVFLCDNFCGDDHDEMAGTIVVDED